MKPENLQPESETPPAIETEFNHVTNDQAPSVVSDHQSLDTLPKQPRRRHKKLYIAAILLFVSAIILGIIIWKGSDKKPDQQSSKSGTTEKISGSNKIDFFGNKIPQVDCSEVKNLARDGKLLESSKSNYLCYKGGFTVDSEKMQYAAIQLTPEFQKEWQKKCTVDCGSSPDDYPAESENEGNFIVRANKKVEYYSGFGGGGLESLIAEITGCGNSNTSIGISDKLGDGKLKIDDNKLGLLSKFSDLKVTDGLGNTCTINIEFVSYLTSSSDGWELVKSVSIKKAAVHYELKDLSSCSSGQTRSANISCYTAQAALRNDVTICENLASPQTANSITNGHDECIMTVAKRSRDPQTCDKIRYYREQFLSECQKYANDYKLVLKNDITIN